MEQIREVFIKRKYILNLINNEIQSAKQIDAQELWREKCLKC